MSEAHRADRPPPPRRGCATRRCPPRGRTPCTRPPSSCWRAAACPLRAPWPESCSPRPAPSVDAATGRLRLPERARAPRSGDGAGLVRAARPRRRPRRRGRRRPRRPAGRPGRRPRRRRGRAARRRPARGGGRRPAYPASGRAARRAGRDRQARAGLRRPERGPGRRRDRRRRRPGRPRRRPQAAARRGRAQRRSVRARPAARLRARRPRLRLSRGAACAATSRCPTAPRPWSPCTPPRWPPARRSSSPRRARPTSCRPCRRPSRSTPRASGWARRGSPPSPSSPSSRATPACPSRPAFRRAVRRPTNGWRPPTAPPSPWPRRSAARPCWPPPATPTTARVYSPAQLVLDAETWSNVAAVAAGITVDDETIALETIAAIGIGGNALAQRHTRRHMKDVWRPRLFDRSAFEAWRARRAAQAPPGRAAALADEVCPGHEVPPLDAEKRATLRRIIATAGL